MRKSLLLIALMALTMQAQTAKDPLKLVIGGENKYEYGGGYTNQYFFGFTFISGI